MNQKSKSNIQKMDSKKSFYRLLASDAFFLKGGKMREQKWMQIYCKCTRCSQLGCIGEGFLFGFASNALLAFRQCLFDFFLGCKWAMHSGKEWLIFLVVVSKKIAKSSGFNSWLWIANSTLPCGLRVERRLAHTWNEKRRKEKKIRVKKLKSSLCTFICINWKKNNHFLR